MTIDELIKVLQDFSAQGHGSKKAVVLSGDDMVHEPVDPRVYDDEVILG